jgi:hypothetical protein
MFKRTGTRKWLVAATIGLLFSASAHSAVLDITGTMSSLGASFQTKSYDFNINSIGTYQAILTDYHAPAAFTYLFLAVTDTGAGGATLGSISTAGFFNFTATHTGSYTAGFFGAPGQIGNLPFNGSTYGITVAAVPEPEVWALMLIGVGLIGYQLRRKSKSGPVRMTAC